MPTMEDIKSWRGHGARGSHGDKIGKIEDICLDRETGKPEGMTANTRLFGFELLAETRLDGDAVAVPYDKAEVNDAPRADADGQFSAVAESDLSGNEPRSAGRAGGSGTRGHGF
jgi:sporulation protein YlmC with PRC-barrel domain